MRYRPKIRYFCFIFIFWAVGFTPFAAETPDWPSWLPEAPPLPEPEGPVIDVATVDELFQAAEDVAPGGTIRIADGHYMMPRYFEITTDSVTLRSASGDPRTVILDGAESRHGELVGITACSGVTIAGVTVQNVTFNAIKINNNRDVQDVTIYNCIIRNVWQRGVKSVRSPDIPSHNGEIAYNLFYNERPKRFEDDPTDTEDTFGGDYVGAIDLMDAVGWRIHHNVFVGVAGRTGCGRGAVFIWHDSRDCVIESNVVVDCDGGINLGNPHKPGDVDMHCRGFVARNNMIARAPMGAITAVYTEDCTVAHHTIYDADNRWGRSIRLVRGNPGFRAENNLIAGHPIRLEDVNGDTAVLENNVEDAVSAWFADTAAGDLRLTEAARAALTPAPVVEAAPADILGVERADGTAFPGAHEPEGDSGP